jgi:hypothetical protein
MISAFVVAMLLGGCSVSQKMKEIVIDETIYAEVVEDSVSIDSVWAGHPVGFCLLTNGNRQYIAYYNATRNMVVGQRSLHEPEFSLTYNASHNPRNPWRNQYSTELG